MQRIFNTRVIIVNPKKLQRSSRAAPHKYKYKKVHTFTCIHRSRHSYIRIHTLRLRASVPFCSVLLALISFGGACWWTVSVPSQKYKRKYKIVAAPQVAAKSIEQRFKVLGTKQQANRRHYTCPSAHYTWRWRIPRRQIKRAAQLRLMKSTFSFRMSTVSWAERFSGQ